jgi:hypothetical protein
MLMTFAAADDDDDAYGEDEDFLVHFIAVAM